MKTPKEFQDLLERKGYTLEDVKNAFSRKIKELSGKEFIREKDPLGEKEHKRKVGRFVTLIQSDYPYKMFILQELYAGEEAEVRIGYYIVSKKKLANEGILSIQWGQFSPNFPKGDLKELIRRAEEKGIL